MENKTYVAIDLKSFYASVECVQRGLDPLKTNLVVADPTRTEKTICLAVSPSLKAYGISGRARLFEVVQSVKGINAERLAKAPDKKFTGKSFMDPELKENPSLKLDYIVAPPQMRKYMEISSRIFQMYLKYVAPEDIHVYSVDEVFIDATQYLKLYKTDAWNFTMMLVKAVLNETGITATAGIGPNLFLCKIAMDVQAKHIQPDENGVRIAQLTEQSFREQLWDHKPITDFWRIGPGTAKRLAQHGMFTLGDVARCSIGKPSDFLNEDVLYKEFGVNAELLIDHAWGWEPCTIADIKAYKPENNSLSNGQVLSKAYKWEEARIIVQEMTDKLVLELVEKHVLCDQIVLSVSYDECCLSDKTIKEKYHGQVVNSYYGKPVPKPAHGSINLGKYSSSTKLIMDKTMELYDDITNRDLYVRRMSVCANHVIPESQYKKENKYQQLDLFTNYEELLVKEEEEKIELEKEKKAQEAILAIHNKYGKNALLKGTNLQECATARERNGQVGGHKG